MWKKSKWWRLGLVMLLLLAWLLPSGESIAVQDEPVDQAQALFDQMSVAERVGQLFLITFPGNEVGRNDPITDLILNYKVGGVVLLAENDNIGGGENVDVPRQVTELTNQLQMVSLIGERAFITDTIRGDDRMPAPTLPPTGTQIPLFIATRHEGDGPPYNQIYSGLTQVPSAMAIGATWQPDLAEDAGQVTGRELSTIGINLLLGPALDVLESPNPESPGDLGTRSFGGDPYWVGLMGQAYTAGVHSGSDGRVAVIARHFPGQGSSDRPLGEEVSTVRKSLEELRRMELAPFFAVTGRADNPLSMVDGLMTTHIRYQGFQGNIQPNTPPVSFDPVALQELMSLPEFQEWRQTGGLVVSDPLGVPAVQRFYNGTEQQFPHRRVAKDALLAGNDVLYLGSFAQETGDFQRQLDNVQDTITWFQEKYLTDPAFQQRVDEAVLGILRLKLRLYGDNFNLQNVLADSAELTSVLRQGGAAMLRLAQEAITLISPGPAELAERMPTPPGPNDRIVIFTDVREASQCSDCPSEAYIGLTDLEERLLALYGPEGSEQIQDDRIQSFSFTDLKEFLAAGPERILPPTPPPTPQTQEEPPQEGDILTPEPSQAPSTAYLVQTALDEADWIIFAMLDVTPEVPHSDALQEFLKQRQDLVRNSRLVVFAYNAPYFLDTTEVSKLTAYYGLYSKTDPFIDTSVRALFQETSLRGAPPVDIASVNYLLDEVTRPDPNQVIELYVIRNGTPHAPPSEEPLELVVGDTLRLQTGVIYDQNGRPVPDGTMVQFVRQDRLEGFISVIGEQPTVNGMATLDYVLEARTGQFRITTVAGEANNSQQLDIVIEENEARAVMITPTPAPSPTPTATSTPTFTPTPTASPSPTPTPTATPAAANDEPSVDISLTDFQMLLGVFIGLLVTGSAGWTAAGRNGHDDLSQRIRLIAWGYVGGLLAYNYYLLGLPGAGSLQLFGSWASLLTTTGGGLLGLVLGWLQVAGRLPAPKEGLG